MARTVNEAVHAARRNAILDAAQRAIGTIGYEKMAIADILGELQISSGAFYHYFDSKPALLLALVERMGNQVEQIVLPIIHDPTPGALDKLQRFFAAFDQWKLAHKPLVLAFLRVWYADENAIVRHKLYTARIKRLAPWLEAIIRQGTEEKVLTTPYPDQAARMVISLLEDLAYATVELLLSEAHSPDDLPRLERIVEACTDALERMLGAPAGCLQRASREEISQWLVPPSPKQEEQRVQPPSFLVKTSE
ncbi:MAG: TetR/AcrR family transcriptional regulator [Ktedonobacteraceae bacterium]|nr:TetR/AcrR family transcriptional regulator [Chloroflexota bacterium]